MKFFLTGFAIGVLLLFVVIGLGAGSKAQQPISFNHKKHVAQGLDCDHCHRFYKTQTFAGMPDLSICLECHQEPVTKSPEEEKIRKLLKQGEEVHWGRLYQQPDHVFFSHRRHVALGELECQTCHGKIGESERPPSRPLVKMTMDSCMNCHAQSQVSNDCLACHV